MARKPVAVLSSEEVHQRYIKNSEAALLIREGKAEWWIDLKAVRLLPAMLTPKGEKVTWAPRQSGYAGPLVLQVVT